MAATTKAQGRTAEAGTQVLSDKAGAVLKDLTRYLDTATPREKIIALIFYKLHFGDLQDKLNSPAGYDGRIGDDLDTAWEHDLEEAELDAEDLQALETMDFLWDATT